MRFSLVLATIGRTQEVNHFLEHLAAQSYQEFELIVVDQNKDGRLISVLAPYQERFPVLHLRKIPRGASKARNIGLKHASGDIIAFPDDDCWYPPKLLEEVEAFFRNNPHVDAVVPDGGHNRSLIAWLMNLVYRGKPKRVSYFSMPGTVDLFLRRKVVDVVGAFDERLGPGAPTNLIGAEDWDYVIRIMKSGFTIRRAPTIPRVQFIRIFDAKKAYHYGISAGYVWRKHALPMYTVVLRTALFAFNMLETALKGSHEELRWSWVWTKGFFRGWLGQDE